MRSHFARVDLGADHNGRVVVRRVFEHPDGSRFIQENGKRLTLILWNTRKGPNIINYVMAPKRENK